MITCHEIYSCYEKFLALLRVRIKADQREHVQIMKRIKYIYIYIYIYYVCMYTDYFKTLDKGKWVNY
jgi:hypothetical protein